VDDVEDVITASRNDSGAANPQQGN